VQPPDGSLDHKSARSPLYTELRYNISRGIAMLPRGLWGPKEFTDMTDEELHQVKMGSQFGSNYWAWATAEQEERERKRLVPPPTTINISQSTIATLNLGTVVGEINSSIQTLTNAGQDDLAKSIRQLTEAISASTDLDESIRKDMLEHLALVSAEAALPAGKRKMAPLRSSIEVLRSTVSLGTQLVTLWQAVEHALKAVGILHQ
jgi:hypothetical protein